MSQDRITNDDLARALEQHVAALDTLGIKYDGRLVLSHGSKTYGRAFRLNRIPNGETGHWAPPIGSDFLGMTKREAYDELVGRTRVLWDVHYAQTWED
jgi:hypothetical protein